MSDSALDLEKVADYGQAIQFLETSPDKRGIAQLAGRPVDASELKMLGIYPIPFPAGFAKPSQAEALSAIPSATLDAASAIFIEEPAAGHKNGRATVYEGPLYELTRGDRIRAQRQGRSTGVTR